MATFGQRSAGGSSIPGASRGAPVVSADRVTKTYRIYARPWDRLRELVSAPSRHTPVKALDGVSFELQRGESLGIIGENGAGKSTLLSILAGVITPSAGRLDVQGPTASLLELGMGFHPELTGRQNIRLNAAFQGIGEKEIERLTPEIIEFSELGEFVDRPVKIYSTGMTMRLGFAIAVQVEPEVLIVDEALSVGDGYFQKKCMDRLLRFLRSGRTLLFCSHALYYVSAFCRRALWLHHGQARAYGPVDEVVRGYENYLAAKAQRQEEPPDFERGPAKLEAVRFVERPEEEAPVYRPGETWQLEIEWQTESPEIETQIGVTINTVSDVQVCSFGSHQDGEPSFTGACGYRARLSIPELPLLKGEFSLWVYVLDGVGLHVYDQRLLPAAFSVASPSYRFGLVQMDHSWDGLGSARGEGAEDAP